MKSLEQRVETALKIADITGQGDESMPRSKEEMAIDLTTIAAVLRGQWDVEFHGNTYTIVNLQRPRPVK